MTSDPGSSPLTLIWPSAKRNQSSSSLNQSWHSKASRDSDHSLGDFEAVSIPERKFSSGAKKVELFPGANEPQVEPPYRLRARRAAVSSVASSGNLFEETESNDSVCDLTNKMPMTKNKFKITAKFIGSLQKHACQKTRAERAAAAAALATYLTDPNR